MDDQHPLITVDELAQLAGTASLRIADTRWYLGEPDRGHNAFHQGHIPNAVYVHLERDLSAEEGPGRHPLPDRGVFAETMGRRGIGDQDLVVAYDDRGGAVAARLWWMLRDIGHERVRVLDGGLDAWTEAGHPLSISILSPPRAAMTVRPSPTATIDRDSLAGRLGSVTLLDARAPERFRGEVEPMDPAAGHIPSARSAPFEENLDADGRFRSRAELRERFDALDVDETTVVYCGSGVTACHNALAIKAAGLPEPTLYPGSWSDWSTAGLPVATGDA